MRCMRWVHRWNAPFERPPISNQCTGITENCTISFENQGSFFLYTIRNCTNPCQIILEYEGKISYSVPSLNSLSDTLKAMVGSLSAQFIQRYQDKNVGDKCDVLLKAPKQLLYLIEAFGNSFNRPLKKVTDKKCFLDRNLWSISYRSTLLKALASLQRTSQDSLGNGRFWSFSSHLSNHKVEIPLYFNYLTSFNKTGKQSLSRLCEFEFAGFSGLDRLLLFVHPRVSRLLELLQRMNPANENEDPTQ